MHELLKQIFSGQNQFASGGLLLMVVGSIGVFLRSLPGRLWAWIVGQCTMTVTVKDEDAAFRWVKEWFIEQPFLARVRRVDLDTTLRGAQLALIPAPGRHWFWYRGRPIWVYFYRSVESNGYTRQRSESLTFETVGRDRQFVKSLVDEIVACHRKKLGTSSSYLYVYDEGWNYLEAYSPRLLDSVILRPGEKEHLLQDLEKFRASRDRYRRLGVPYHRGYLLYGPPGTGKTSLVSALGAKCGMSIYVVNLTDFTDKSLKKAINDVPENSIVLFEDIDCMRAGHRREQVEGSEPQLVPAEGREKKPEPQIGVTLSGLLNVLDGFFAPENVVFVMTTNHMQMLDPALLRPGRIDYRLYMGEASDRQRVELYRRFFSEATEEEAVEFAQAHCTETMAEFQGLLLRLEQEWNCLETETECSQVL